MVCNPYKRMQGDGFLFHYLVLSFQWICMARHWQMLLVPGFSDCSWAEFDVDRSRPVIKRNVLEIANLPLEGYFRALYVPLGGSRTQKENASLKSMELYVSMLSDKPPLMPLCVGTVDHTARGGWGFFLYLSLYSSIFSFFKLCSSSFFFSFFFLFFFYFQFLFFFFCFFFFLRLSFQPGWVM